MAENGSHALVPPSGVSSKSSFNRPLAIARNALETGVGVAELVAGAATIETGVGAVLAFHGGLSTSASATKLVASITMSEEQYQKMEEQIPVVSGFGVGVLVGEGIYSSFTGKSFNFERAASLSEAANVVFDAKSFFDKPEWSVGAYSKAKNFFSGYSKLQQGIAVYTVLGASAPPRRYTVGQSMSPPGSTIHRGPPGTPASHDSRVEHEIRERGGTPRSDNTDRVREQVERHLERPGEPRGSGKSYIA